MVQKLHKHTHYDADIPNSRFSEKGRGLKRNPHNYLRVTMLSCYIEIVLFPSSLLPIKCTKKSKLTKEPSENACERSSSYGTHCRSGQVEEVSRWCQYQILDAFGVFLNF